MERAANGKVFVMVAEVERASCYQYFCG